MLGDVRGTRPTLAVIGLVAACGGPEPATSSLSTSTAGVVLPPSGESRTSTSTTTAAATGPEPGSSSGSGPGDDSTGSTGQEAELLRDVGGDDLGSSQPVGCKGKIDFLFMISRFGTMQYIQEEVVAAFPAFIETIETKFADFDYHIMVVDSDADWGHYGCNEDCVPEECPVEDYPCDLVDKLGVCETTMGAGTVHPVGYGSSNKQCPILGGRRYFTHEQPHLLETFACAATVGVSGYDLLGEAVSAAVSPELNGPGGCNEGFLRDDALLMVTFIASDYDHLSEGKPKLWADAILEAKHGDPDSVVMFSINDPDCPPYDRICDLVKFYFPRWYIADNDDPDYAPAFEIATDMVIDACSSFIPQ